MDLQALLPVLLGAAGAGAVELLRLRQSTHKDDTSAAVQQRQNELAAAGALQDDQRELIALLQAELRHVNDMLRQQRDELSKCWERVRDAGTGQQG